MGSVSLPVGDGSRHEKKKDMKTETSFRFHILLLFLSPMHSIGAGRRELLAHQITFTPIQSSLRGRGGTLSEREFPRISFPSKKYEPIAHQVIFTPIQSSLEGAWGKPLCEREVPPSISYPQPENSVLSGVPSPKLTVMASST